MRSAALCLHGITGWTPATSPGCRPGGCCCWSRCRSSAGSTTSPPPSDASTCSSIGTKTKSRWSLVFQLLSPHMEIFECGFGPHQWVGIAVALRRLLPDTFSRCGIAVETHILWAELQQRGPFSRSWGGWPRVSVNHPGSRVLPCSPAAVQLQRKNACRWRWIHNVDRLFWTRTGTIEIVFTLRVADVIKKALASKYSIIFFKNGRKCWDPCKKKCIFGCFHTNWVLGQNTAGFCSCGGLS